MISTADVIEIIKQNTTDIDTAKLDNSENLRAQGIDSLDMMSILFALEERFKVHFSEEAIDGGKLNSINAILDYIKHNS